MYLKERVIILSNLDYKRKVNSYISKVLAHRLTLTMTIKDNYTKFNLFNGYVYNRFRSDDGIKSNNSMNRARNMIQELIYLNADFEKMAFITLTFKENIQVHDKAYSKFDYFMRKYRKVQSNLKYLGVWEYQKRGAIHFHLLIFNYKKVDISKLWTYGFSNVQEINCFDNFESIGNYLGKYLGKQPIQFNRKMYFTSRNLKRNKKIQIPERFVDLYLYDLSMNANVSFEKGYNTVYLEKELEND